MTRIKPLATALVFLTLQKISTIFFEIKKRRETVRDIPSYKLEVIDVLAIAAETFTTSTQKCSQPLQNLRVPGIRRVILNNP